MDATLKEYVIYSMIEGAEPFNEALTWAVNFLEVEEPKTLTVRAYDEIKEAVFSHLASNFEGDELIEELERRSINHKQEITFGRW